MQCVSLQRKIEGVTADLTRGLQPSGESELPRLARKSSRQQPMLDLCRQGQRNRALSPFEEIGVPAVRNHDVCQEVRSQSDIGDRLLKGEVVQPQLQDADRLAAAGHRREQASTAILDDHLDRLGGQGPPVRRPSQWHAFRGFLPLQPQRPGPARAAQSDQRIPTEAAIRKLTSRAPIASAISAASTSTAATGGAASTAARIQVQRRLPALTHVALT
jgi:hypothetical protein